MRDIFKVRLGTRNSPMAIAFAELVKRAMVAVCPHMSIVIETYTSDGDRIQGSLAPYGGKGMFIKDLEQRLLNGQIDLAVHALKDIPGDIPMHEDLKIGAYLPRHDVRDCLILRPGMRGEDLKKSSMMIGTSAPRRQAIIRRWLPEARCRPIRGNINARLRKLDEGRFDALMLAVSGLKHLAMDERIDHYLSVDDVLPAIGQGIICLQMRRSDLERLSFLSRINDPDTACVAAVERQLLSRLKGNCHSAIAGLCELDHQQGEARFKAVVFEMDGPVTLVAKERMRLTEGADPVLLGTLVADNLLAQGAARIL